MNQLKRFLQGDISWVDPSIITKLQQYGTIQMDAKMYPTSDIIKRIQQQGCPNCVVITQIL